MLLPGIRFVASNEKKQEIKIKWFLPPYFPLPTPVQCLKQNVTNGVAAVIVAIQADNARCQRRVHGIVTKSLVIHVDNEKTGYAQTKLDLCIVPGCP